MKQVFNIAKNYGVMFVIAIIWMITINPIIVLKSGIMVTYWIFINMHQIRGGIIKRIIWNIAYIFTAALIIHALDWSIPGIAIKIISKVPLFGKAVDLVAVIIKMPEAGIWAIISVTFGWIAGIIDLEELPGLERQIILRIEELRYR